LGRQSKFVIACDQFILFYAHNFSDVAENINLTHQRLKTLRCFVNQFGLLSNKALLPGEFQFNFGEKLIGSLAFGLFDLLDCLFKIL
jgi:hypothetical protein